MEDMLIMIIIKFVGRQILYFKQRDPANTNTPAEGPGKHDHQHRNYAKTMAQTTPGTPVV